MSTQPLSAWDASPFEPEVKARDRGMATSAAAHHTDLRIAREIAREVKARDRGLKLSAAAHHTDESEPNSDRIEAPASERDWVPHRRA